MADGGSGNDLACLYRAVAAGESEQHVRCLIEQCGSKEQREAAVNARITRANGSSETPLQAAHRRRDGPLVGALLEYGADAQQLSSDAHPLALAIHYGRVSTLRELLRQGHDPNQKLRYDRGGGPLGSGRGHYRVRRSPFCRPVHLCIVPPRAFSARQSFRPPHLECLRVLVREFNADVNGRDWGDETPLFWLPDVAPSRIERAFDLLVELGADIHALDRFDQTPIFALAGRPTIALRLLSLGASADEIDVDGFSPLILACMSTAGDERGGPRLELILTLLRASSCETRRATEDLHGDSALDTLIIFGTSDGIATARWRYRAMRELLAAGVPLKHENALRVVPMAARRANEVEAEVAARVPRPMTWRGHEGMVKLAFAFRDAREADERVRATERRVRELEEELAELGAGTESDKAEEEGEEGAEGGGEGGDDDESGPAPPTEEEEEEDEDDDGPWW